MIFRVFRASGMPLMLEEDEVHALATLDAQGRWEELTHYEKELRDSDDLKEIRIEAENLKELRFALEAIDSHNRFTLDFENMIIEIQDQGRDS